MGLNAISVAHSAVICSMTFALIIRSISDAENCLAVGSARYARYGAEWNRLTLSLSKST